MANGLPGGGGYPPPPPPPMPPGFPGAPNGFSGQTGCSCPGCNGKSQSFSPNLMNRMYPSMQSWYDAALMQPMDPRIVIANCEFGGIQGTFVRTTAFKASSWIANTFVYTGTPKCETLHTDDALAVAEAAQWTFAHQIINMAAANPPALNKLAFMRVGPDNQMVFDIDLGASSYTDLLLSFRDNAAVPGAFVSGGTGTIPAIQFTGTLTGVKTMKVALKQLGTFVMGLKAVTGGNNSLMEMEWVVIP